MIQGTMDNDMGFGIVEFMFIQHHADFFHGQRDYFYSFIRFGLFPDAFKSSGKIEMNDLT